MKKSFFFRSQCVLLAAALLLPLAACKSQSEAISDEYSTEVIVTTSTIKKGSDSQSADSKTNSSGGGSSQNGTGSASSGNSGNSGKTTSLSRDQFIAQMPAKLKGKTLTYMYWNDPMKQMDGEAIKAFEKASGCKVKCEIVSYDGFQETLSARISSGKAPDLVRLLGNVSWQITALQPITNSGYNFNDTVWDSQLMKDYTFNGKCYAVNLNDSAISDVSVIYYNKKALQDAEMEDPYQIWKKNPKAWTWEKFWSMCEQFVNANKNKSGYSGATFEYGDSYVRAMGGYIINYNSSTGKFVNGSKLNSTISSWQTTLQMQEKGLLLENHSEQSFDGGKTLFFLSGPFSARAKDNRQSALKSRNRLGVVPMPTDSKYQVMYEYTAFGIPEGSKNAALVPYYLRYVLDKKSYDMNSVYCSSEAKEVIDYACSIKNRTYAYSAGAGSVVTALKKAGSAQVKATLDSHSAAMDEFIEAENKRVSNFG